MSSRRNAILIVWLFALPVVCSAAPRWIAESTRTARAELPGKPTGPIAVEHRLAAEPAVGVPLTITITARVEGGATGLTIDASASRPSAVLLTVPTQIASSESAYSWTLTVVPLAADAGYLNVIVAGDVDGLAQARSVAIALRSVAAEPRAEPEAHPHTETLIALPVRETR